MYLEVVSLIEWECKYIVKVRIEVESRIWVYFVENGE